MAEIGLIEVSAHQKMGNMKMPVTRTATDVTEDASAARVPSELHLEERMNSVEVMITSNSVSSEMVEA
jgi:hypothetical protein